MRLKIKAIALLLMTVCAMSSCLKSDYDETVTYDDTAITSMTLGTLKCYMHTKSSKGTDSIYTIQVSGSKYPLYIDQNKSEIYNTDSLPKGTDMAHVLLTVNTKNSGLAMLKSLTSDSVGVFNSTDSLDFSVPRNIYVVSQSGFYYRNYKVKIVAHKEAADSFEWKAMASVPAIASFKSIRSVAVGGKVYVLGAKNGTSELLSVGTSGVDTFSAVQMPKALSENATMITDSKQLFVLDKEMIYSTANGVDWIEIPAAGIGKLVGVCAKEMYALSNEGMMMVSLDGGNNWVVDMIDSSASVLPSKDINCIAMSTLVNADVSNAILIGNRDENVFSKDVATVVWTKIVDDNFANDQPWTYSVIDDKNHFYLPCMKNVSVVTYDKRLLAVGGKGVAGNVQNAFNQMYYSLDCGLTWHKDTRFSLPTDISEDADVATLAVDEDNYLWLIAAGSGQVWRARLSQLGWTTNQSYFDK